MTKKHFLKIFILLPEKNAVCVTFTNMKHFELQYYFMTNNILLLIKRFMSAKKRLIPFFNIY